MVSCRGYMSTLRTREYVVGIPFGPVAALLTCGAHCRDRSGSRDHGLGHFRRMLMSYLRQPRRRLQSWQMAMSLRQLFVIVSSQTPKSRHGLYDNVMTWKVTKPCSKLAFFMFFLLAVFYRVFISIPEDAAGAERVACSCGIRLLFVIPVTMPSYFNIQDSPIHARLLYYTWSSGFHLDQDT